MTAVNKLTQKGFEPLSIPIKLVVNKEFDKAYQLQIVDLTNIFQFCNVGESVHKDDCQ